MFDKVAAVWRVLRAGEKVADPVAWKLGQVAASDLAALLGALVALAGVFGIQIDVSPEQALQIAGGVVALAGVVNKLLTVATTDKIGAALVGARPTPCDGVPAAAAERVAPVRDGGAGQPAAGDDGAADPRGVPVEPAAPLRRDVRGPAGGGGSANEFHDDYRGGGGD